MSTSDMLVKLTQMYLDAERCRADQAERKVSELERQLGQAECHLTARQVSIDALAEGVEKEIGLCAHWMSQYADSRQEAAQLSDRVVDLEKKLAQAHRLLDSSAKEYNALLASQARQAPSGHHKDCDSGGCAPYCPYPALFRKQAAPVPQPQKCPALVPGAEIPYPPSGDTYERHVENMKKARKLSEYLSTLGSRAAQDCGCRIKVQAYEARCPHGNLINRTEVPTQDNSDLIQKAGAIVGSALGAAGIYPGPALSAAANAHCENMRPGASVPHTSEFRDAWEIRESFEAGWNAALKASNGVSDEQD